jgi:TolB protein
MERALAVAVLILLTAACGATETEQSSSGATETEQSSGGADACTADLTQVIGPNPELHGATWSPDGRRIAFSAGDGKRAGIYAVTVASCALVRLGPPANLIAGSPDWSSANVIAFDATKRGGTEQGIYTMTADGGGVRRLTDGPDLFPAWSPDGTRIAFARGGYAESTDDAYANRNIWVVSSVGSGLRQVTDGRWHGSADWSPDGERLVTDTEPGVVELGVDGSGRRVLLEGDYSDPSWSPDGDVLLFSAGLGGGLRLAEGGQLPSESLDTPIAGSPEWSPNGERIAFTDGENEADLWIVRHDGTGLRQLTTVRR